MQVISLPFNIKSIPFNIAAWAWVSEATLSKKFLYYMFNITFYIQKIMCLLYTVELQWLEPLSDHENIFETGVVRANEC